MSYTMRPLKTSDIFKMSKILKKMDIKFEVDEKITQTQLGVQFIQRILENVHQAENEVNSFLAELVGLTTEEFMELPIEDTLEIISLFKEQKGLANFLKLAGK
jgi:archaellum biogenesis ATPase FlaH